MFILKALLTLLLFKTSFCNELNNVFEQMNIDFGKFNAEAAKIAWDSAIEPYSLELPKRAAYYQKHRMIWQQKTCDKLAILDNSQMMNDTQRRQTYLLCRGPKYTYDEARTTSKLYEELQAIYSQAEICFPTDKQFNSNNMREIESAILNYLSNMNVGLWNFEVATLADKKGNYCLKGESDVDKMMTFSRNEEVLRWLWLEWREKVGPSMKKPFRMLVNIENEAARRNGYWDIGESWREDLEIPNLRRFCRRLYDKIRPLYTLLHGVVRFFLRQHYGDIVPEMGPIPAHLLGNLWSQNWESIADLIIPDIINLDQSINKLNWTVSHMVKRADDFYQSLGLPAMTDKFWRESVFTRASPEMRCHGAAADMFQNGDYRLMYCAEVSKEDLYVIHHELGHIQYYMAYENQPALFRQANAAFQEAIGDTIMYGVLTPQHLHRLGFINDSTLYSNNSNQANMNLNTDEMLLLKQALNRLPQITFSLVIDEFRWMFFEGDALNRDFWKMVLNMQGISPPGERGEEYFDAGAKFHVPDNTPYIRYFLSSFLQHQLFEKLCKAAVFGRRDVVGPLPSTITTNRCDIYGSKVAGKILKDIMSRGHSQHWRDILHTTTGEIDITEDALLRYYQPLYSVLAKLVRTYRIPIGW